MAFTGGIVETVEDGKEAFAGHEESAGDVVRGEGFGNGGADV